MTLTFGTAGLRGEMKPGSDGMNLDTVTRATFGLTRVLLDKVGVDFKVIIGFDARHHSFEFAEITARVITGAGGKAALMPQPCPTPLLAFHLQETGADAGVMITASHNPAGDNGYKVYLGGRAVHGFGSGAQLISPWDERIMSAIESAPSASEIPLGQSYDLIDQGLWTRYRQAVSSLGENTIRYSNLANPSDTHSSIANQTSRPHRISSSPVSSLLEAEVANDSLDSRGSFRIVHTAMHGVGAELAEAVLADAGFKEVFPVASQREPNPDFPTVAFPNPEEPGALDLAIDLANEVGADLILANDPDADRMAAAIPDSNTSTGWRQLTGDEVGALLGWQACEIAQKSGLSAGVTVARSVVSGELLDRVAFAAGIQPMVSLTGFKWISRTPRMIFGYEEALGCCVDPFAVRDKDGISAAIRFADLASRLRAKHRTVQDLLDELAMKHGLYVTSPLTFRLDDLSLIGKGLANLRERGLKQLGEEGISFSLDLSRNKPRNPEKTSVCAGWENLQELPATEALFFATASGTRAVVRPSGTEPKLKCYFQVVVPDVAPETLADARYRACETLKIMEAQLQSGLGLKLS